MIWICHNLLIHLFLDKHLECFQFFAIMSKADVDISQQGNSPFIPPRFSFSAQGLLFQQYCNNWTRLVFQEFCLWTILSVDYFTYRTQQRVIQDLRVGIHITTPEVGSVNFAIQGDVGDGSPRARRGLKHPHPRRRDSGRGSPLAFQEVSTSSPASGALPLRWLGQGSSGKCSAHTTWSLMNFHSWRGGCSQFFPYCGVLVQFFYSSEVFRQGTAINLGDKSQGPWEAFPLTEPLSVWVEARSSIPWCQGLQRVLLKLCSSDFFNSPTIYSECFHFSVALGTVSLLYLSSGILLVIISVLYICFWFSWGRVKPACFFVTILELEVFPTSNCLMSFLYAYQVKF